MAQHNDFGKEAEDFAVSYLEKLGYQILKRNYRYLSAEIDIIAQHSGEIVIIEVKARSTDKVISPKDAVNRKKIRLLMSAANHFMEQNNREEEVRFDIISILPSPTGQLQVTHIKNAFQSIDG